MLKILREKVQGIVIWFIVLAITATFAFFGLNDYFYVGNGQRFAAKVDNEKISWAAVDKLYERVSQQYGSEIDQKSLKDQILKAMVQRVTWLKAVKALGFRVGEKQVAALLVQIPAFQVDGKFSKDQYLKVLAEASYTDVGFRQELSQDVLLGQLEQGLVQSSFTMPNELSNAVALLDQKRDFGYMLVSVEKYQEDPKVSVEKIQSYYETHQANFVKPEQVALEYIDLSLQDLMETIKPSKEEVLAYYREHQAQYTLPERVHARHILVTAPEKIDAALDEEAKNKVEGLLAKLKEGGSFSDLAKSFSEDKGSAETGGDLGWFVRGQMVPEFEKVAFGLTPGSISEPVRTQFGYHLIQLVEHKDSEVRHFTEVQNLAEEQLQRERAETLFSEKSELFAKLAFEEITGLTSAAKQLGLKIKETEPFSRAGAGDKGISDNPEVLKVAFSEELLKQGRNSELIKLSENAVAIVRVRKHYPAEQQTLEQVQKQIQQRLVFEQAKVRVKEVGEKCVSEIKNGTNPTQMAKQEKLKWTVKSDILRASSGDVDRQIVMAAFQVPVLSSVNRNVKGFVLPNGDYLVVVLNAVKLGSLVKMDPETQNAYRQGLTEVSSQLEYALYTNQALQEAKIELLKAPS